MRSKALEKARERVAQRDTVIRDLRSQLRRAKALAIELSRFDERSAKAEVKQLRAQVRRLKQQVSFQADLIVKNAPPG